MKAIVPPFGRTAFHEIRMWRQVLKCARRGHFIVGIGREAKNAPYYCWTCFYNYPYTCFIGWNHAARNWLGGFLKGAL